MPIEGYADLVVYDSEDNVLEVVDAKSKTGFSFKKSFKEGVALGPWTQSWIYGVLKGAERIAVLNLAKENISVNAASKMRDVSEAERYSSEFTKLTRDWDLPGYKELARMWGINRLAHEKGMLGKRVIPEYGDGTEVIAPNRACSRTAPPPGSASATARGSSSASPTAPAGSRSPRPACSPSA